MNAVATQPAPMVIVGCSRRKAVTDVPLPALELYQGGRVPDLRARVVNRPDLRRQTWIISAEHGLVGADTPLLPYDRRMDLERAIALREQVRTVIARLTARGRAPSAVLAVAEPIYLTALAELSSLLPGRPITWLSSPSRDWSRAEEQLNTWSWPCP